VWSHNVTIMRSHPSWIVTAFVLVAGAMVAGLWVWAPVLLYPDLDPAVLAQVPDAHSRIQAQQATAALRNEARASLVQGSAAMLIVVGAVAAWRQVKVGREGHITGQLSHAIDQIGSDNPDVQTGGIYTLERISRLSPYDRLSIMFLLGSFVRRHAPWEPAADQGSRFTEPVDMTLPWLRIRQPVVQTALHVLSRRAVDPMAARLYLARTDLRSLQINEGGQLTNANLNYANLARAWLQGVLLDHAGLKQADLRNANLQGTSMISADLRGANLCGANLRGANLKDADLTDVITDESTIWP
jgi:hypothetical protein